MSAALGRSNNTNRSGDSRHSPKADHGIVTFESGPRIVKSVAETSTLVVAGGPPRDLYFQSARTTIKPSITGKINGRQVRGTS